MDTGSQQAGPTRSPGAELETIVDDTKQLLVLALDARDEGRFDDAVELFGRLIELEPDNPNHHYLIGKVEHSRGEFTRAIDHLTNANRLYAQSADIHASLGMAYVELNRFVEASEWYQSALRLDSEFVPALHNMGLLLLTVEQFDEAALFFEHILEGDPNRPSALVYLGRVRLGQKRPDDAITLFERALALDPTTSGGHELLGIALRDLGRHGEAEAAFRDGLGHDPTNSNILYNLTYALLDQSRVNKAFTTARKNVFANPESALAHMALGHIYGVLKEPAKGLPHLRKAIELKPDNLGVKMNVGKALESASKPEEALAVYIDVVVEDPRFEDAFARCVDATVSLGHWDRYDELLATLRKVVEDEVTRDEAPKVLAFNLQALPIDYRMIAKSARQAARAIKRAERSEKSRFAFDHRKHGGILKVGYLLPYTWRHSLPMVLKPVIEAHPRNGVGLHGYCVRPDNDTPFSAAYRAAFDDFTDVSSLPALQAAERIYADGIDVLIDVSGHTNISCLPILAHRPAPVQAHFLGYSITTGADFVDYLITDREFMPPALSVHNAEKSVYLPGSFMIAPRRRLVRTSASRAEQGLPEDEFVIANFNHPCKFEPEIFATWMRILKRIPRAVLWCGAWIEATKHNLQAEAERQGVAGSRLVFAEQIDRDEHCARLTLADLALDTYFHGGGITSVDALSAGVPLLSASWQTPGSRMGATLLNAIGMSNLLCSDLSEYEDRAVHLADAPAELGALRARLNERIDSLPLFDLDRYARQLESAYHLMWEAFLDGTGPREIDVPPIDGNDMRWAS